jgi:DNA invertase Pin-like site-specific DNA recombinase
MVLIVFAGMAEFQRALIHQRTSSGRDAAMKRGVRFGQPVTLTAAQIALGQRLIGEGQPPRDVARTFKVHAATFYRSPGKQTLAASTPLRTEQTAHRGPFRRITSVDFEN